MKNKEFWTKGTQGVEKQVKMKRIILGNYEQSNYKCYDNRWQTLHNSMIQGQEAGDIVYIA